MPIELGSIPVNANLPSSDGPNAPRYRNSLASRRPCSKTGGTTGRAYREALSRRHVRTYLSDLRHAGGLPAFVIRSLSLCHKGPN